MLGRSVFVATLVAFIAASSSGASAQTVVPAGNLSTQTWTLVGSPYVISGDVTIPAGVTLTVDAGVEIQVAANTDSQASGLDSNRVEVVVAGTLKLNGTANAEVTIHTVGGTSTSWYGVVVQAAAVEATFAHTTISNSRYGVRTAAAGSAVSISDSTIHTCQSAGLYVEAGSPTATNLTVYGCDMGVYAASPGTIGLTGSILRNNTSYGLYVSQSGSSVSTSDYGTIHQNGIAGVYHVPSGPGNILLVRNSNVTNNGSYGVYKTAALGSLAVMNSNVWNNGGSPSANIAGSSATVTATISANPLYVAASNVRLTSNSPSRFASTTGTDIGALPYTGDATTELVGTLWANTTLTLAGSPYSVPGDLTVAASTTLTIEPGVAIHFAANDDMIAGDDLDDVELRVLGILSASGTALAPILLDGEGVGAGAWWGIRMLGASASTLSRLVIDEAQTGIYQAAAASHSYSRLEIRRCSIRGIWANTGRVTADSVLVSESTEGVYVETTGSVTLTNPILASNSGAGLSLYQSAGSTDSFVTNGTIVYNGANGILRSISGGSGTFDVRNSIIAGNQSYGVQQTGTTPAMTLQYSNIWGNSNGNVSGTGISEQNNLSANPQFVSAPSNLRLMTSSVCVDSGTTGAGNDADGRTRPIDGNGVLGAEWDMGAFEYALPVCGNAIPEAGEPCDDGNPTEGDACDSNCTVPACGNAILAGAEACDDGNSTNGDGCDSSCVVEPLDAGVMPDAGSTTDDGGIADSGIPPIDSDDGGTAAAGSKGGCAVASAGAPSPGVDSIGLLGAAAIVWIAARRRRRRVQESLSPRPALRVRSKRRTPCTRRRIGSVRRHRARAPGS